MIDQSSINFLVKLSLACFLLSLAIYVDCKAIETKRQFSGTGSEAAANDIYQYQHTQPQHQDYQQQAQQAQNNYQYYDQQQQQQYQNFGTQPSGSGSTSNKPNRRSILSSLMAPFTALREQGMSMLSASLQGCQPGTFSVWCRFWSMFIRR